MRRSVWAAAAILVILVTQATLGASLTNVPLGNDTVPAAPLPTACPPTAPVRTYQVTALPVPISYNHWGDIDLQGELFVEQSRQVPLLTDVGTKLADAGLGDIASGVLGLRDALAAYDVPRALAASGKIAAAVPKTIADHPVPRERVDTTDLVEPLVLRAHVGDCVHIELLDVLTTSVSFHAHSLVTPAGAGEALGTNAPDLTAPGELHEYVMWIPPWAGMEGSHFVHSHADSRDQTRHGLFGAIVAEAQGTTWWSPADDATPAPTGLDAIIEPRSGSSFREFIQIYHDEVSILDWQLNPLPLVSNITHEYGPGTKAISLRNEPFYDRFLYNEGLHSVGDAERDFDKSQSYGSYAYGDPGTHMQRSYVGDPVKFRLTNAGPGQPHIHHLHGGGIRWRSSPVADPSQFDAGLVKTDNPQDESASQRTDVQNMDPGESFNLEPEGGSGGVQQSVGDFLYHCHIAEHYLSGMWSIWRVYNTLQPDLAPLPDRVDRVAPSVNSSALLGGVTPDGVTLTPETLGAWVEPMLPARGVPGVEDASVWDWTREGTTYYGEPESAVAFPNFKADAPGRLAAGARPELQFDPINGRLAYPMLRPHFGERPPFAPDHGPAPYLGLTATPTRPDGLCPSTARPLAYNVVAIPANVAYNAFDNDTRGEVLVRAEDRAANQAPGAEPTSLVLRANAGDCVDVTFTNALQETTLDESALGVHHKTNIHIHLVQFDVQASDGVVTGFNYETTVRPLVGASSLTTFEDTPIGDPSAPVTTEVAGPLVHDGGNTIVPVSLVDAFLDATGAPKLGSLVGIGLGIPGTEQGHLVAVDVEAKTITLQGTLGPHAEGEILGYEFVHYRWYPDVDLGIVYFHDHVNGLDTWRHGLFGSLVVEPRGSQWLDPKRTTDGGPDQPTAHVVDIVPASGPAFREIVLHFQDRACVDPSDCVDPSRPLPPDIKMEPAGFNLRSEPLWRRDPAAPFATEGAPPSTDALRAYVGDRVEIRMLYAGQSQSRGAGTFGVTGHRFQAEENLPGSRTVDAMSVAISSQQNWRLECGAGGCAHQPGDYLYMMTNPDYLQRGAWGLLQVLPAADASLRPLPDHAPEATGSMGTPTRFYDVAAIQGTVVHNMRTGQRSDMMRFVPLAEAQHSKLTASMRPPDPLVLRAHAGETIQINLTSLLPAGSGRVGLHAGLLSAGPAGQGVRVGDGPEQTVAPGETISYVWKADRELGVADLVSLADPAHDAMDGLYGALVVEPADASWTPDVGPSADVKLASGVVAREHVLLFSSEDGQYESSTMPYLPDVQGRVLVNYGSEPLHKGATVPAPLGVASLTGADTCQLDEACAPRELRVRNPVDPFATVMPRTATPTIDAKKGQPLILRFVGAAGDQLASVHVDGHVFAMDNDMPHCRTDLASCRSNLVDTFTMGPGETHDAWIPAAGPGGAGDYMWRNHRDAFFEAGAWGILRVR